MSRPEPTDAEWKELLDLMAKESAARAFRIGAALAKFHAAVATHNDLLRSAQHSLPPLTDAQP